MPIDHAQMFGRRTRSAPSACASQPWALAGVLALLCSGVAWASLPRRWKRLRNKSAMAGSRRGPLSGGGVTGMAMAPTDKVVDVGFVRSARCRAQASDAESRLRCHRTAANPRACRRRTLLVPPRRRGFAAGRGPISCRARDTNRCRRGRAKRQLRHRAGGDGNCFTQDSSVSARRAAARQMDDRRPEANGSTPPTRPAGADTAVLRCRPTDRSHLISATAITRSSTSRGSMRVSTSGPAGEARSSLRETDR